MNELQIVKKGLIYYIYVDSVLQALRYSTTEVLHWLDFNWPSGTKVHWMINYENKTIQSK